MDEIFTALANSTRRRMLDVLRANPGCCVGDLCNEFDMSRIGAMKHLAVLEAADLVISRTEGRKRLLYANAMPIHMIYERWTTDWSAMWAQEIGSLKDRAEAAHAANEPATNDPASGEQQKVDHR